MSKDNVFELIQPGAFDDQLTEILRQGRVACWLRLQRPRSRIIWASMQT